MFKFSISLEMYNKQSELLAEWASEIKEEFDHKIIPKMKEDIEDKYEKNQRQFTRKCNEDHKRYKNNFSKIFLQVIFKTLQIDSLW